MMSYSEDLYYMLGALLSHYKLKYPEQTEIVADICMMIGKLLNVQRHEGGGGVGMVRGWIECIREFETGTNENAVS